MPLSSPHSHVHSHRVVYAIMFSTCMARTVFFLSLVLLLFSCANNNNNNCCRRVFLIVNANDSIHNRRHCLCHQYDRMRRTTCTMLRIWQSKMPQSMWKKVEFVIQSHTRIQHTSTWRRFLFSRLRRVAIPTQIQIHLCTQYNGSHKSYEVYSLSH